MKKTCRNCDKTDGICYTSNPPKFRCEVTGEYHTYDYECDVEEDNVNKQDKPRICEVLGVEVGEQFKIHAIDAEYCINEYGEMMCVSNGFHLKCGGILETIINRPDHIIRKPQLTEEEIGDAKAILKFFPDVDMIARTAGDLSKEDSPELYAATRKGSVIFIENNLFPSIRPGQSVMLSEICGGDAE